MKLVKKSPHRTFLTSWTAPVRYRTGAVQSVKEHVQQGADKRAAGELEGQRFAARDLKDAPILKQRFAPSWRPC